MLNAIINKFNNNFFKNLAEDIRLANILQSTKGALMNYKRSNSNLWVSSLCYFSILGLIPILAIIFSIGRWLNIDNYIIDNIIKNSPIDKYSLAFLIKTTQNLLETTRNGILAGFGFFFLGFSVLSLFSLIEKSFNSIWKVKTSKKFSKKVGDFLIIFTSFPLTLLSMNILDKKISLFYSFKIINFLAPYLALWAFFTIFYTIIPNTKIRIVDTILSGLLVSILLNQSNLILVKLQFVIQGYGKVYGSFSIILIFIIWLKIIWFIILLGAHFTYILQNKDFLKNIEGIKNLNFSSKYQISILILKEFIINFKNNKPPLTVKEISEKTSFPMMITQDIIYLLKDIELISEITLENPQYESCYKLSYNLTSLTLKDVKTLLEKNGDSYNFNSINENIDLMNLDQKIVDTL